MDTREGSSFPVRLSRRLSLIQALILVAVVIAGGLALSSAAGIYRINALIDQEYNHALLIQRVHLTFHEMLATADQIELGEGAHGVGELRALEERLDGHVRAVVARQGETRAATDEQLDDAPLIAELQRFASEIRGLTTEFASSVDDRLLRARALEALEKSAVKGAQVATSLVDLHQGGVRQLLVVGQRRLTAIFALYAALLLGGVVFVGIANRLGNRWITTPIRRLAEAAHLLATGRLEARVPVQSRDEVGSLSHSFNLMAERLTATYDQLRRKISETHALYQVGSEISALTELEPILRWVTDKARELVGTDAAALCLLSPAGDELFLRTFSGRQDMLRVTDGAVEAVPLAGSAPDVRGASLKIFHGERVQAHLPTVLRRADTPIGVLVVVSAAPREFSADERELVSGLATQAAIAIENARLYEEVQRLAMLEERRRLAQEIHDGVAQTIGLLHLKLRHLQDTLPQTDAAATAGAVREITRLAEAAYEEARRSIFDLRAIVARGSGLVPMLAEYADEFTTQSGIPVAFEPEAAGSIRLPPTAEVQVVRIVQEALSNVRRHAGAKQACVRLSRQDEWVHVTVEDDGRGWDLQTAHWADKAHFGLRTMRERAQSLGGTLEIDSTPGRGTRVTAKVPAEQRR